MEQALKKIEPADVDDPEDDGIIPYEYQYYYFSVGKPDSEYQSIVEWLNALGKNGWRLVGSIEKINTNGYLGYAGYFVRRADKNNSKFRNQNSEMQHPADAEGRE